MIEQIINGINYYLDEENLTAEVIKKKNGYDSDIIIPETIEFNGASYRITSIGRGAFWDCESLTSISIPNCVEVIEDCAFHGCKKLPSITMPDSLKVIGDSAFLGCESLKVIAIPNSVEIIGDYAFACCTSLTSITFQGAAPWMKGIGLGDGWHSGSPAKIVIVPMQM